MFVLYNKLVEIVPKEVSTDGPSMSIIDTEKRALGPLLAFKVLRFRLHNVQNNGNPVLIIISHDTLVGVGAVARNQPVPLVGELRVLVIRKCLKLGRLA
jgi:hypothetical protein